MRREDVAAGLALRLMAEGGFGVKQTAAVRERLANQGHDEALIDHVERMLELQRANETHPAARKRLAKSVEAVTGAPPSPAILNEAHRLKLQGMSVALLAAREDDTGRDLAEDVLSSVLGHHLRPGLRPHV